MKPTLFSEIFPGNSCKNIKGSAATLPFKSQSIRFAERNTCALLHCRMPKIRCEYINSRVGKIFLNI